MLGSLPRAMCIHWKASLNSASSSSCSFYSMHIISAPEWALANSSRMRLTGISRTEGMSSLPGLWKPLSPHPSLSGPRGHKHNTGWAQSTPGTSPVLRELTGIWLYISEERTDSLVSSLALSQGSQQSVSLQGIFSSFQYFVSILKAWRCLF